MRSLTALLLLALALATGLFAETAAQTPAAPAAELPKTENHYAPEAVPEAATRTATRLTAIRESIEKSKASDEGKAKLSEFLKTLRKVRESAEREKSEESTLRELRTWHETILQHRRELEKVNERLKKRIEEYGAILQRLQEMRTRWQATLEAAKERQAPKAIVERAAETLKSVDGLLEATKKRYDETLTALDTLAGERQRYDLLASRMEERLAQRSTELFTLDHAPLWSDVARRGLHPLRYFEGLVSAGRTILRQSVEFYRVNLGAFYAHMVTTLLAGLLLLYLYLRQRRGQLKAKPRRFHDEALLFIRHPAAATVLLAVLMAPLFYPERPQAVGQFNALVALAALLWIIHGLILPRVRPYVYLLSLLFLWSSLQAHIGGLETDVRFAWFLMSLLLLAASLAMLRPGGPLRSEKYDTEIRFFVRLAPLVPLVAFVALVADLLGAVNLSTRLIQALITSLLLFMLFLAVARIFRGLVAIFVQRRAALSGHMLQEAKRIESYLVFTIDLFFMGYWTYLVLKQFNLLYFVENWWQAFTALSWKVGEVSVSVGAVVDFLFVLVLTWFLTRFVTILLDLELFSRYRFPRGVPAAIQMIVRYLIITVGVIFGLTALGVRLTDLSILAGALGVGIGFGLRNIMANFVSGLLLIFERPVQQGDVVEVGGVYGDIQKIGVRATTIKTYDGSEVIVPNADFITKEVTNWTLSSKSRRVKMQFKVAFGNDPRKVIEIIREVVASNPAIRKEPAPKILFEGYGDYYLEFTVYFWVDEKILDVKSETGLAIYEALTDAGVEMPVPFYKLSER